MQGTGHGADARQCEDRSRLDSRTAERTWPCLTEAPCREARCPSAAPSLSCASGGAHAALEGSACPVDSSLLSDLHNPSSLSASGLHARCAQQCSLHRLPLQSQVHRAGVYALQLSQHVRESTQRAPQACQSLAGVVLQLLACAERTCMQMQTAARHLWSGSHKRSGLLTAGSAAPEFAMLAPAHEAAPPAQQVSSEPVIHGGTRTHVS